MVLTLDPSVRSQSLGGAYVAPADDGGALFWNPAGLQRVDRQEFSFAHGALFGEQTQDTAVYVRPAWRFGERETWAVGVSRLADAPLALTEEGADLGTAHPSESVVSAAYARPLGFGSFGVSGKYIRQESFEAAGSAYAVDAGAQGSIGRRGKWGLSLANLGTEMSVGSSHTKLPLVVRSGVAVDFTVGSGGNLLGTGQIDVPADDALRLRAGVEFSQSAGQNVRLSVRAGYASGVDARYTLGAGIDVQGVAVNYAFSPSDELGPVNRVDLRWRFGTPLAQETRRNALFAQARAAIAKGRLSDAEDALDEARSLSPRSQEGRGLHQDLAVRMAEILDPAVLLDQGRRSLAKGDMDGAELAFRKVLLVRPGNADAQKGLEKISAAAAARRTEEARVAVARAKDRKKQEGAGRARDAMKRGDWTLALGRWRELADLEVDNKTVQAEIVRCREAIYQDAIQLEQAWRWEEAKSKFRAAQEGLDTYRDSAEHLKMLSEKEARSRAAEAEVHRAEGVKKYEEGRTVYREGNVAKAKTLFEEAVRLDPDNKTYRRALERARQEMGPRAP